MLKPNVDQGAVKHLWKRSLRRLSGYAVLCFGVALLVVAVLVLAFSGAILNGYCKEKVERAFAAAHPGYTLRSGRLAYTFGGNRLMAQSVTLGTTNSTLKTGRISLTGVRWASLLLGTTTLADALAKSSLEATNLDLEFPKAEYALHCERLRASVPGLELIVEGTELRALVGDADFFAAHDFRTTRFHVVVPECRVLGLAYGELFQGKSYRARSVEFSQPSFDALVNTDKKLDPFRKRPLMVSEVLAAISQPLRVDRLSVTNGHLTYCERVVAGAEPGVLTVGAVNMSVEGIANRGESPASSIQFHAEGDLMNAGTMKVQMTIPVDSPDFSFHYSGSLGAMDLTQLDAFLDIAERTRVKSGRVQTASFDIEVTAGQARGYVRAIYKDLEIAVLDKQTDTEKGLNNRLASFLTNVLKIRNSNVPDAAGSMKEGDVNYTKRPEEEFLQFAWFAMRTGVLDVISH